MTSIHELFAFVAKAASAIHGIGLSREMLCYLMVMNVAGFFLMKSDKRRAVEETWRIPERILLLTAILGGSLGSLQGMQVFRHKTQHWQFYFGLPFLVVVHGLLVFWIAKPVWFDAEHMRAFMEGFVK